MKMINELNFFRSYIALAMLYITTFFHRVLIKTDETIETTNGRQLHEIAGEYLISSIVPGLIAMGFFFAVFLLVKDFIQLLSSKDKNKWKNFAPVVIVLVIWICIFNYYLDSIMMTFFLFIAALFNPLSLLLIIIAISINLRSSKK